MLITENGSRAARGRGVGIVNPVLSQEKILYFNPGLTVMGKKIPL